MTTTYRPLSIDERFFGHTTIVNVPVSVPLENLPGVSAALVDTTLMTPDLRRSNLKGPTTFAEVGAFMTKNWAYIFVGAILIGYTYRYYMIQQQKIKEITPTNL